MALQNYSKTTWENTPSTATPLNAANLNHIEAGIKAVTDAVIAMHNAGISPENIAATIVNAAKLPNGSNDELVKVDSSGSFARAGTFVSNDQTKIINNSSVEKYVPTARAVAILYYVDSDGTRHTLFNFSEEFYTAAEVDSNITGLLEYYAPRSETAPAMTVGFSRYGIPAVILSATTFSAGACTNTNIKKLYVPSTVTRINGGAFSSCTALTDVYIDNTATGITVNSSAFPSGVIVHYHTNTGRMTFNVVDELIKAINTICAAL